MTTFLAYFPSPPQGVWHLGPLPVRAYALFIIIGIVASLVIGDRRWAARGGQRGVIYDIALWAVPFGLIGGRLYHLATDWRTYWGPGGAGTVAALRIWDGGLGIWGAIALGGVGAWLGCRRRGIPLPAFGDALAPGIILAQAIGRLGNYFNQELYGRETTLPWGLQIFYRRDPSGYVDPHSLDGVSTGQVALVVQPTFLYELIWNLLVFVVLIYVDRRFKLGHGRLFALYVAGYCVGRFGVELLRNDTATLIAGIRINVFTSTFVFIGAVVYMILAPKGREDPATLRGNYVEEEAPEREPVTVAAAIAAATPVGAADGEKAEDEEPEAEDEEPEIEAAEAEEEEPETEAAETEREEKVEPEAEAETSKEENAEPETEAEEPEAGEPEAAAEEAEEVEKSEAAAEVAEPEVAVEESAEEPEEAETEESEAEAEELEVEAEDEEPEVADAEDAVAGAGETESAESEAAEADAVATEAAGAEAVEPEAEELEAEAEAEEAEVAEPVAPEGDSVEQAATEAEAAEPEAEEAEAEEAEVAEPEAPEGGSAEPVATEAEAVEPEAEELEAEELEAEAEAEEAEVAEPEAPEGDSVEQAATEAEAVEPEAEELEAEAEDEELDAAEAEDAVAEAPGGDSAEPAPAVSEDIEPQADSGPSQPEEAAKEAAGETSADDATMSAAAGTTRRRFSLRLRRRRDR
ncbi:prolipoprotein diacylglyceryl transferase [Mycobacterium alsense]|uniref:Phosphatidylglycerol--prolipoprotein diacylglyceryl transferase n=1 Tax=Mycobacterium alsense TaxID=324058 RepID=A0AA41XWL4_9MYCO|nr:prolipoprotein diacylglyceryl transferase [Mycobacterium alsense]MCV7381810.1 prolipoprotein diacylglyceryl transferase [Mycobacterium alsense]OQZ88582.1 prolipoprotein diacylglyceryl transferase [Mycobacterium alsense]